MSKKRNLQFKEPLIGFAQYGLDKLVSGWGFPRAVDECIGKTVRISMGIPGEISFSTITAVCIRKNELLIAVHPIPWRHGSVNELTFTGEKEDESGWVATVEYRNHQRLPDHISASCAVISD